MKLLTSFGIVAGALLLTACSNNENLSSELTGEDTYVTFNINVNQNSTRAASTDEEGVGASPDNEGKYSIDDECTVANVKLYVFNNGEYETTVDCTPTQDNSTYKTDPTKVKVGQKVIFVVSGSNNISLNPTTGMSVENFEKEAFNAYNTSDDSGETLKIAVAKDFVMIGKSDTKSIVKCDANNIPASNTFNLTIERAAAKAQVKFVNTEDDGNDNVIIADMIDADFGENGQYAILQAAKQMVVDWHATYTPNSSGGTDNAANGVYNGYTTSATYKSTVTAFTEGSSVSEGSAHPYTYFSENWVASPTTGNTTYAGVKFTLTPNKCKKWDSDKEELVDDDTELTDGTFYSVARRNRWHGYVYYAMVDSKNVYFASETEAEAYAASLNGTTLTDDDDTTDESSDSYETHRNNDSFLGKYEVITFSKGEVYYRVNLQRSNETDVAQNMKYRVDRNSFVQISIDRINALGKPEDGIVPGNPDEPLESETYIVCTFSLRPWTIVPQSAELD